MSKTIELTQGRSAIVDDQDYKKLRNHNWSVVKQGNTFYAVRYVGTVDGKQSTISMHREILGLVKGDPGISDHRNRNGLDNRRSNLRIVSNSVNLRNHRKHSTNTSGHTGVCWHKNNETWIARIGANNRMINIGSFDDIRDAVKARRRGEIAYWGQPATN